MKRLALGAALAMLASPAFAADAVVYEPAAAPVAAQYNWTGFYAGLHAGYGFGDGDGSTSLLPDPASFGAQPFSSSTDLDGFIGGAQAGYNWQFNNYLLGIEADITWSDMDGTHRVSPLSDGTGTPVPGWFQEGQGELDWFGTLRARAGVLARPNILLYATGGLAFGRVEYTTFTSFTPAPQFQYSGSGSDTKVGWTIGGGAEWAFAQNWTFKAEYLYFDLGETDFVASPLAPNAPFAVTQSFDTSGNIVRVGLNYKF